MAQSISPSSKVSNLKADNEPAREVFQGVDLGSAQVQSPQQQSLLARVRENLDLTKHLGLTSSQNTTAMSSEASPPQSPLTIRLWQGANAVKEKMTGKQAIESHGEEIDRGNYPTGGGVTSEDSSFESHPNDPTESDGRTWTQWAGENAIMVKDTAASTVKYVTAAAASKLPNVTEPATDMKTKKGDMGRGDKKSATQTLVESGAGLKGTIAKRLGYSGDNEISESSDDNMPTSVQDVVDRYSTTTRKPEVGQHSVTKAVIDIGLGLKDGIATQLGYGPQPDTPAAARAAGIQERTRNMAETWRQSTVFALTPGDGDKELATTISKKLAIGR